MECWQELDDNALQETGVCALCPKLEGNRKRLAALSKGQRMAYNKDVKDFDQKHRQRQIIHRLKQNYEDLQYDLDDYMISGNQDNPKHRKVADSMQAALNHIAKAIQDHYDILDSLEAVSTFTYTRPVGRRWAPRKNSPPPSDPPRHTTQETTTTTTTVQEQPSSPAPVRPWVTVVKEVAPEVLKTPNVSNVVARHHCTYCKRTHPRGICTKCNTAHCFTGQSCPNKTPGPEMTTQQPPLDAEILKAPMKVLYPDGNYSVAYKGKYHDKVYLIMCNHQKRTGMKLQVDNTTWSLPPPKDPLWQQLCTQKDLAFLDWSTFKGQCPNVPTLNVRDWAGIPATANYTYVGIDPGTGKHVISGCNVEHVGGKLIHSVKTGNGSCGSFVIAHCDGRHFVVGSHAGTFGGGPMPNYCWVYSKN
jgi:hypothetical protein